MADSPSGAGASGSPHRSPQRSPREHNDLDGDILKGAAWAPPWTEHELHSREVYARSKTPSPPCGKFKRDSVLEETSPEVVKKMGEDSKRSLEENKKRHQHQGIVMKRAREFERKSREECEKHSKHKTEYKGRMKKHEDESKPPFRNRAEQIIALGLHKKPPSRPQSPKK